MNGDNYRKALERAMNLCSRSEQCIKDIQGKLNSWRLTSETENYSIIQRLLDNKFIDEKRYARSYVQDKLRFNKWGRVKIRVMLKSRGINEDDIEYGLGMIDHDSYIKMIEEEMDSKKRSIKAKNLFDLKGKLYRFAESRGYEREIFYDIINKPNI
ncbi:MAG: RecX family transcriptional regulator [Bacteroidales bacterium]|nr:RecX family transcriptional regulator [Bacteroidales bacterium]